MEIVILQQARRLEAVVRATLRFIEKSIPEEVRQTNADRFKWCGEVMALPVDKAEGIIKRATALMWAINFVFQYYEGRVDGEAAPEIEAALMLLAELGLIRVDVCPLSPASWLN
jgi:hypothetical protein